MPTENLFYSEMSAEIVQSENFKLNYISFSKANTQITIQSLSMRIKLFIY